MTAVIRTQRISYLCALLLLTAIPGCDDEPTCVLSTTLAGGYDGALDWNLEGRGSCGFADATNISPNSTMIAFVDDSTGVSQNFYIVAETPILGAANFPGQVLFFVGDNFWESGASNCTVSLVTFESENWSRIDFANVRGTVECDGPLVSASPEHEDITMTSVLFSAHIHRELLSFDYI